MKSTSLWWGGRQTRLSDQPMPASNSGRRYRSAGTLDRDAIRDAIAATDMDTVIGHVTFSEDGTGNVVTALLQYQNGKRN